jgi:hypothetical protein
MRECQVLVSLRSLSCHFMQLEHSSHCQITLHSLVQIPNCRVLPLTNVWSVKDFCRNLLLSLFSSGASDVIMHE